MPLLFLSAPQVAFLQMQRLLIERQRGVKLNFCPPMLASYIKPPLATVKVAMPL